MTPSQCRAARALIDWPQPTLAEHANLGLSTIVDFEKQRRTVSPEALAAIRSALEAAGVVFIPENGGGVGVRLKFNSREVRAIDKLENEGGIVRDDDV